MRDRGPECPIVRKTSNTVNTDILRYGAGAPIRSHALWQHPSAARPPDGSTSAPHRASRSSNGAAGRGVQIGLNAQNGTIRSAESTRRGADGECCSPRIHGRRPPSAGGSAEPIRQESDISRRPPVFSLRAYESWRRYGARRQTLTGTREGGSSGHGPGRVRGCRSPAPHRSAGLSARHVRLRQLPPIPPRSPALLATEAGSDSQPPTPSGARMMAISNSEPRPSSPPSRFAGTFVR